MTLYVAVVGVHDEGSYAYIFDECSGKAEEVANEIAGNRDGILEEVCLAADYVGGGVFEICTC